MGQYSRLQRRHLFLLAMTGTVTLRTVIAQRPPSLFVFVPSMIRSRGLVSLLREALPGIEVVAFGRFADFVSAVRSLKPTAALSLQASLRSVGVPIDLFGIGQGGARERYVVLTHRDDVSLANLGSRRLGLVDIVGRTEMPSLAQHLLGLSSKPRIRRVLKVSDLLPLLSLDLADAIVVPERMERSVRLATRLELNLIKPPAALLGRAALSFVGGVRVPLIEQGLRQLSTAARHALGIDDWGEEQ